MTKLLGIALVVTAATFLGMSKAYVLKERVVFLNDFTQALETMRAEICTRLTPMPELVAYLSGAMKGSCAVFFSQLHARLEHLGEKRFSEMWCEQVDEFNTTVLNDEERSAMRALGMSLGRYDAQAQNAALQTAISRMRKLTDEARTQSSVLGRLWTTLGISAGIMLAILMM